MTYRSDAHVSAFYRIKENLPNIILNGKEKQWVIKQLAKKKLAVCGANNFFILATHRPSTVQCKLYYSWLITGFQKELNYEEFEQILPYIYCDILYTI